MDSIQLVIARNADGGFHAVHFGDADFFAAYTLRADGTLEPGAVVPNASKSADKTHGAQIKMKTVLAALAPVHCVVAARISPNFKRMACEAPIQPVVVRCSSDEDFLACLSRECADLLEWVARRGRGQPLPAVPVLAANSSARPNEKEPS